MDLQEFDRVYTSFQAFHAEFAPDFGRKQSENIRRLFAARTKELPSTDFVEMLRSAIKEDEWMIYLHGAVLGLAGGLIHLGIFG